MDTFVDLSMFEAWALGVTFGVMLTWFVMGE